MKTRRQQIEDTTTDLLGTFLYYGRKEDEDLPRGAIQEAVKLGEITVEEIVGIFAAGLREACK